MEDRLYTKPEIARKTANNPYGLGLINLNYNNIDDKILRLKLGFSDKKTLTNGRGQVKYKFSLKDIEDYNNKYGRK